jgi:hypothetical protein
LLGTVAIDLLFPGTEAVTVDGRLRFLSRDRKVELALSGHSWRLATSVLRISLQRAFQSSTARDGVLPAISPNATSRTSFTTLGAPTTK